MFSSKFSKPISITFLPKHADGIFKLESYKKNQNLNNLERRREHLLLFSRYAVDETSKLLPRKVHTETRTMRMRRTISSRVMAMTKPLTTCIT